MGGGEDHRGPAALAIAGDQRFRAVRMTRVHFPQKGRFGRAHIRQGLTRLRLGEEDDEIDRVAVPQSDADFGLAFETADAAAVSGARIDDDPRASILARRHRSLWRVNAHERVIDGAV